MEGTVLNYLANCAIVIFSVNSLCDHLELHHDMRPRFVEEGYAHYAFFTLSDRDFNRAVPTAFFAPGNVDEMSRYNLSYSDS